MFDSPAPWCFSMSASGWPIGVAGPRARIWSSDAAPAPKACGLKLGPSAPRLVHLEDLHREIADLDHVVGLDRRRFIGTDPRTVQHYGVHGGHHGEDMARALQI